MLTHCVKSVCTGSYSGPHFSRIFPHWDWIRKDTEYLSIFSPNAGKCGKNVDQDNSEYGHFLRSISLRSVRMRENQWKMRTRVTPNMDSFYAVTEKTKSSASSTSINSSNNKKHLVSQDTKKVVSMIFDSSLHGADQHSLCTKYDNMRVENHQAVTAEDICNHRHSEIQKKPDVISIHAETNYIASNITIRVWQIQFDRNYQNCKLAIWNIPAKKDNEITRKVEKINILAKGTK